MRILRAPRQLLQRVASSGEEPGNRRNTQGLRFAALTLLAASLAFLSCGPIPPQEYPNIARQSIPFATAPFFPALTPDGQYLLLTFQAGSLAKIRVSDDSVVATTYLGGNPLGIALDPDGEYAYITCYLTDSVAVVRVSDLQVVAEIWVGARPGLPAVSPDGKRIYVPNTWSRLIKVVSSDWKVVDSVRVDGDPWGVAVSRDGERAYVTCRERWCVDVIRTSDDSVVDRLWTAGWGTPVFPLLAPDGEHLYVSLNGTYYEPSGGVISFQLTDGTAEQVARYDADLTGLALVDEGRYLFAADFRDSYVYVIRTSDFAVVDRIDVGHSPDYLAAVPGQDEVYVPVGSEKAIIVLGH